jgi:tetratricopeptide (TPR) repeat protein
VAQDTIMARSLDLSPKAESFYNEGVKLLLDNKYEMAIAAFDVSIDMDKKFYKAYLNRGLAKMNIKKYSDAINDFEKAIHLNDKSDKAFFNRGICNDYLGFSEAAFNDL